MLSPVGFFTPQRRVCSGGGLLVLLKRDHWHVDISLPTGAKYRTGWWFRGFGETSDKSFNEMGWWSDRIANIFLHIFETCETTNQRNIKNNKSLDHAKDDRQRRDKVKIGFCYCSWDELGHISSLSSFVKSIQWEKSSRRCGVASVQGEALNGHSLQKLLHRIKIGRVESKNRLFQTWWPSGWWGFSMFQLFSWTENHPLGWSHWSILIGKPSRAEMS